MKTLFLITVIALSYGLAIDALAQKVAVLPGSEYTSRVRFGENDVTVPSRFGTHILISVNINGSPMELALDTGASYSPMAAPIAEKLRLKRVKGNYVGCTVQEYAQVKIEIGKIVIENQRLCPNRPYGWDSEVGESKFKVPALLGYDFLRNFVVEVDYAHGVVVLHNPATFKYHPDKSYVGKVPFRLVNGTPHVEVTVIFRDESRRKIDALVDMGSFEPMIITQPILEMMAKESPIRSWEFGEQWVLNIRGWRKYEQRSALAGPINFDVILGNPALAYYKVIFDYPHNQLILNDSLDR